ncbi:cell wall protein PhiA [Xylariaceae sp. FL0804]|nr:cell wall protein PhiA [Xylariaceae sp. FL0804]
MFTATTTILSALFAGAASALPQPQPMSPPTPITGDTKFNLQALTADSSSALNYAGVSAALNGLDLNFVGQNATCDTTNNVLTATFHLQDGSLFLYGPDDQEMYVDRSGMGQGVIQYTTGDVSAPKNAERGGWALSGDENQLTLFGAGFVACPGNLDSYSLWMDVGDATPAGQTGCKGVQIYANSAPAPVSCEYTDYSA